MALIDKASLLMVPSVYEDGKLYNVLPSGNKAPDETGNHNGYDQTRADFTFSRDGSGASKATRVNASGLIEKGRDNLLLQSNSFDTTWVNSDTSVTSGQSGYDGTNSAWLLAITGASGFQTLRQTISVSGVHTISIYAKANALNWMRITNGVSNTYFDISNGVVGTDTSIGASIESAGNGFFRCSIPFSGAGSYVYIYPATGDGNVSQTSGSIYIQNAQLEKGLVATDYIETTTAAASAGLLGDMPRLDYSGGASSASLLLEPSRTNTTSNSEYLDGHSKTRVEFVHNAATSPQGVVNAVEFNDTATIGTHFFKAAGNQTNGAILSFFAKQNTHRYVQAGPPSSIGKRVFFDLQDGVMATIGADAEDYYGIEDYGNGWYRCYIEVANNESCAIFTAAGDGSSSAHNNYTGDGSGVYLYGLQVEANVSYHTSYIPTYGTAVARAADSCSVTGASDVIGQTEGTIYAEYESPIDNPASSLFISISDGTLNNTILFGVPGADTNKIRVVGIFSGVSNGGANYSVSDITEIQKVAITYNSSAVNVFLNGVKQTAQTGGSFNASLNKVAYSSGTNTFKYEGQNKEFVLFDSVLSDAECISLTS